MVGLNGLNFRRPAPAMPVSFTNPNTPRFGQLNTWHYRVANILEASITVPGLKHPLTVISPLANPTQGWLDISLNSSEAFGQALVPRRGFPLAELKPHGFDSYDDIFIQLYRKPAQPDTTSRRRPKELLKRHAGLLNFLPLADNDPAYSPLKKDLRELCDTFEASHHWATTDSTDDYKPQPRPPRSQRRGRAGDRDESDDEHNDDDS